MGKNAITVLQEGEKSLDDINAKLKQTIENVLAINEAALKVKKNAFDIKTPKGLNENLRANKTYVNQLNAELKERQRLEQALERQVERNRQAQSKVAKELAKERFETRQRNKTIKETVILSSNLSTEYQKLVVRMNQAGRAVQNLVAKQSQGIKLSKKEQVQLKRTEQEFKKYQFAVRKADASIGRFQRNVGNYKSALGKAGAAIRNFAGAFGVISAGLIAKDIFNLAKELDGLNKALKQVTVTQTAFNQAQQFIKDLANEAGVEITGLQRSYTKFLAAAKTTNLTLEETQDIFRQTAKAGAVLGLSTDDINGSMTALEQILSKGKVQAEEIRGQLGERLPGAFQILAKSMGLTTQELSKQLSLGNVISEDVLPGFARELAKTYSLDTVNKVNTLTAAQNRLTNSWKELINEFTEGSGSDFLIGTINVIGGALKNLQISITAIKKAFNDFSFGINIAIENFKGLINSLGISNKALEPFSKVLKGIYEFLFGTPPAFYFGLALQYLARVVAGTSEVVATLVRNLMQLSVIDLLNPVSGAEKLAKAFTGLGDAYKKGFQSVDKAIEESKIKQELEDRKQLIEDTAAKLVTLYAAKKKDLSIEDARAQLEKLTTEELKKKNAEILKQIKAIKDANDANDDSVTIMESSVAAYKKLIAELEDERDRLATNTKEYQNYTDQIELAQQRIEDLKNGIKSVNELDSQGVSGFVTPSTDEIQSAVEKEVALNEEKYRILKEQGKGFYEFMKGLGFENLDFIAGLTKDEIAVFKDASEQQKSLQIELQSLAKDFVFTSIDSIFQRRVENVQREIDLNNEKYAVLLDNDRLSEEQRLALEAEKERKNKELEKKKRQREKEAFLIQKGLAIAQIAIDLAKTIASINAAAAAMDLLTPFAFGTTGITYRAANIPTAIRLSAIQTGIVLAQALPQFEKGKGEYDNYEGPAIWGEKRREAKISKDGSIEFSPKKIGNHLTTVKKDDIIHPDASKFISSLTDEQLYNDIHKYSILASMQGQSNMINSMLIDKSISNQTDKLIKAYKSNRPKVNVYNNISPSVSEDITYFLRKSNTL